jgi:squalene-hopene/tetraprenyl-beta-curcumene cyclase
MERAIRRALHYLEREQRSDGTWLPLWFGNQNNPNHENPVYGTARVLEALLEVDETEFPSVGKMRQRGLQWLENARHPGLSVEETALRVGLTGKGVENLLEMTSSGMEFPASPIGLYFASLWYSERLYPLIFTVEALKRHARRSKVHQE